MNIIVKCVSLFLFTCGIMQCAPANVPVFFLPADSSSLICAVPGQWSTRISSDHLELGSVDQRIDFLNAKRGIAFTAEEAEDRLNIFSGNDPSKWRSHLSISRRIRYRGVYPGIDVVYYGNGRSLEYDFVVAAGAAPSRIVLGFANGARLKVLNNGDLLVSVGSSSFFQHRPRARQGERVIEASYVIDNSGQRVRIALGDYDHSRSLTIDPVLGWQASVNGNGAAASAATADQAGNMWIVTNFPAPNLTYTRTFGSEGSVREVLVLKIDPTGTDLLYAVLLGGSAGAVANAIAVDAEGNAYLTGSTSSLDFPVTSHALESALPSASAAFVVKLAPDGDSLVYSTYLGGTGVSSGAAIAVDQAGNAFVAGSAGAPDFPLTTGAWATQFGMFPLGTQNALEPLGTGFIAKLNNTGSALLYSTLVNQLPVGIALDATGAVYSVGSWDFTSEFTLVLGDAQGGTVFTKLSPNGTNADFSVSLSCLTPLFQQAQLVALDSRKDIFVAGTSECPTFPQGTAGSFQPQHSLQGSSTSGAQSGDVLIVKLAPDGSSVLNATFLGGKDSDEVSSIAVASDDSLLLAGGTSSNDFPLTRDAFQGAYGGGAIQAAGLSGDGFFAQLSPDLGQLLYSTYLGGSGADYVSSMALDLVDNAYLAGSSFSGLQTPGVFSLGSPGPLWALKIAHDDSPPPVITAVSPSTLTAGSGDTAIQISGAGFASNANALLGTGMISTTFQSSTQLMAVVGAASLTTTGSLTLRVMNPNSGASNAWLIPVVAAAGNNPTPQIATTLPSGLTAGSAAQNVVVTGTGFLASTTAAINGNTRAAALNSDGTLSVTLTATDLANSATLTLTLTNPAPGGGVSNSEAFVVAPTLLPPQPPGLALISPSSSPAGTSATTITVTGSRISPTSVMRWNGVDHAISPSTDNNYVFTASAADLAHAGTAEVTIYDKTTGLESNPLPFWIPFAGTMQDMDWSSTNGLLYLAGMKSVIIADPKTGDVRATVSLDIQPIRLAVSAEGNYLFAGTGGGTLVRRYQLLQAAPWLGTSVDIPVFEMVDFAPVPGSPGSVAIVTSNGVQGQVAIYDGATQRPSTAQLPNATAIRALTFSSDGQTLYYTVGSSKVSRTAMPITSAGVGPAVTTGSSNPYDPAATYFNGRIYTESGAVFDASTLMQVGLVMPSPDAPPLVTSSAIITIGSLFGCGLNAFDPTTFLPIWEEHALADCSLNYPPYTNLFQLGGGDIAFRVSGAYSGTSVYIVREPGPTPLHSIYALNSPLTATFEVGGSGTDDLAILSKQQSVPVTAYLYPDPTSAFASGMITGYSFLTPGYYNVPAVNPNPPPILGQYTGRIPVLLSNSTNPPILTTYDVTLANPFPLQASPASLTFAWHPGSASPMSQSFSLTKQGESFAVGIQLSSPANWLSYRAGSPGTPETITVTVNPTGLAPGVYTSNLKLSYYYGAQAPLLVPVKLTVLSPPSVAGVQDAESNNLTVVPGEWVAMYGTNLDATSRTWAASDFGSGIALPTMLDGVSVQFGQTPAAVYYISPTQIDVQVPNGVSGDVPVTVSLDGVPGPTTHATIGQNAPSLFVYYAGSNTYPAATHADGTLIGDPSLEAGTTQAKPGEPIVLYVNGLAPSEAGVLIPAPVPYTGPVTVSIDAEQAAIGFAGLVAPGQFQINITVPADLAPGNHVIRVTGAGQVSPGTVVLPIQ